MILFPKTKVNSFRVPAANMRQRKTATQKMFFACCARERNKNFAAASPRPAQYFFVTFLPKPGIPFIMKTEQKHGSGDAGR
jgi:hypothetical protein